MINDKLQAIGSKLNVSTQDIKSIQKTHRFSNLKYYIATAIIAILTFILGFFAGQGTCPASSVSPGAGYPFAGGLFTLGASGSKKRASKIAIILLSAIAFFIALKTFPVFGQAMDYDVYAKNKKG